MRSQRFRRSRQGPGRWHGVRTAKAVLKSVQGAGMMA
jgi:hypothetical protein